MSLFDRLLQSAVAVAAAPLFIPDRILPRLGVGATPLSPASVSVTDSAFAVEAAEMGLAEVSLSRLAGSRAVRPEVRAFAARMVDEHARTNSELATLCAGKGIVVPLTPARADRAERDRLDALPADAFDAAYVARMVTDHEHAVAVFRLQSRDGDDAGLRAFAQRMTPVLENHLAAARDLAHGAKGGKGSRKKTHSE